MYNFVPPFLSPKFEALLKKKTSYTFNIQRIVHHWPPFSLTFGQPTNPTFKKMEECINLFKHFLLV